MLHVPPGKVRSENGIAHRPGVEGSGRRARACSAQVLSTYILNKTDGLRIVADFAIAVLANDTVTLASYGLPPDGDKAVTVADKRWAAEWLADRGAGRAVESVQLSMGPGDAAGLSDHELLARLVKTLKPDDPDDRALLSLAASAIDAHAVEVGPSRGGGS